MTLPDEQNIKSGFVMILGLANVGKSTLMNYFLKQKIAIVTPKPQTTRNRVMGIANSKDYQILFLDTPGVCADDTGLNRFLLGEIDKAFADADIICFMVEARRKIKAKEMEIIKRLERFKGPKFLLVNKIDTMEKEKSMEALKEYSNLFPFDQLFPISALKGNNCQKLLAAIVKYLPWGPRFYPEDELSDITERFLAAEVVREKVFFKTRQEIPYSTAVVVNSFKEEKAIIRIQGDIILERNSQKGMVIGKGGRMLKDIGISARKDLEKIFKKKIHLDLFVKVVKDWSKSKHRLKELGYGN